MFHGNTRILLGLKRLRRSPTIINLHQVFILFLNQYSLFVDFVSKELDNVLKVPEDKIRLRIYLNEDDIRDGRVMAIPTKRYLTMKKYRSGGEIIKDEGLDSVKQMILQEIGKKLPYFNCKIHRLTLIKS